MSSACPQNPARTYQRREPEKDLLYRVLIDHLETFLQRTRTSEHSLPSHVEGELRSYLECGLLSYGFLRLRCPDCNTSRTVAFSCKGRGFCPSCMGRRMVDTAARLTDELLPAVPVRQWVLSLPLEIRYRLAYDGPLIGAFLAVFLRTVQTWYRQQARAQGYTDVRCGSVTFIQRFGSALNLNPHFHVLMLDGVYACREEGTAPVFVPAPPLGDADVQRVVEMAAHRLVRLLQQRGVLDETEEDALAEEAPLLSALSAASIQGQLATGPRAGRRVRRLLSDPIEGLPSGRLCFSARGFSLHAATRIEAEDRVGLERLCRYVMRPPLAGGRLQLIDADHLTFRLKTPWSDGTTHLLLSPLELIEKLAALIPPPRLNLVRYHGILAPHARDRHRIVPRPPVPTTASAAGASSGSPRRRRLSWAALLARVFALDVTVCPACGGRLRLIAALTDPDSINTYLTGVGSAAEPPAIAPARPPPQRELDLVA
ncbi:MAG: transposase [Ardenticatenia bacterium]|nr:transposase [Ardenticatenia bacterium]